MHLWGLSFLPFSLPPPWFLCLGAAFINFKCVWSISKVLPPFFPSCFVFLSRFFIACWFLALLWLWFLTSVLMSLHWYWVLQGFLFIAVGSVRLLHFTFCCRNALVWFLAWCIGLRFFWEHWGLQWFFWTCCSFSVIATWRHDSPPWNSLQTPHTFFFSFLPL